MTMNFEPNKCVIFVQSTEIGTHENKANHSNFLQFQIKALNNKVADRLMIIFHTGVTWINHRSYTHGL